MHNVAKRRPGAAGTASAAGRAPLASSPRGGAQRRRLGALILGALSLVVFFLFFSGNARGRQSRDQWAGQTTSSAAPIDQLPDAAGNAVQPLALASLAAPHHVALIMPVFTAAGTRDSARQDKGEAIGRALFGDLFAREEALCYQYSTDPESMTAWTLHPVVVADFPSANAALRELLAAAGAHSIPTSAQDGINGSAGHVTWTVPTANLRPRAQTTGNDNTPPTSCYSTEVTFITIGPADRPVSMVDRRRVPTLLFEHYVDAGLRAASARTAPLFLVLPAHIVPTRAAHTTFEDEQRLPPLGFTEAMLQTMTTRNGGHVAAVQCAVLKSVRATHTEHETVPVPLTALSDYVVVDRGGFVAVASDKHILPLLTRRYAGLRGSDQRVLFEEPIGGVSLQCGLFNRAAVDAVGGLAAALGSYPTEPRRLREADGPRTIHRAGDSAGWKVSLLVQSRLPRWQAYATRAVGVWVPGEVVAGSGAAMPSPLETMLEVPLFALTDGYGQRMYDVIHRIVARRFGVPWRKRLEPVDDAAQGVGSLAPSAPLPPIVRYMVDFPCSCCGLGREAAGYQRPLMERYALTVEGNRDYCSKDGAALLSMAFQRHRRSVFADMPSRDASFWVGKTQGRPQVTFLHVRANKYSKYIRPSHHATKYLMSIGRSLSEFSNVPHDWVDQLKTATNQLWVTADFFRTVYRRHGVDPAKVRVVPEAVDAYEYDPANVEPLRMPFTAGSVKDSMPDLTAEERSKRYVFLSMFKWEERKGWDVLLGAYYDAFGPHAPADLRNRTTLILKVNFRTKYSPGLSQDNIERYLQEWADRTQAIPDMDGLKTFPHIIFVGGGFSNSDLIRLYATADAFVSTSRGEGWGLPASEAMAMGLPLIMTPWSGLLGFMTADTCFQIPLDGVEEINAASKAAYGFNEGKRWALPSRNGTAELMRYVVRNPEHARTVGQRGRRLALDRFSEEAVADTMDAEIAEFLRSEAKQKG